MNLIAHFAQKCTDQIKHMQKQCVSLLQPQPQYSESS